MKPLSHGLPELLSKHLMELRVDKSRALEFAWQMTKTMRKMDEVGDAAEAFKWLTIDLLKVQGELAKGIAEAGGIIPGEALENAASWLTKTMSSGVVVEEPLGLLRRLTKHRGMLIEQAKKILQVAEFAEKAGPVIDKFDIALNQAVQQHIQQMGDLVNKGVGSLFKCISSIFGGGGGGGGGDGCGSNEKPKETVTVTDRDRYSQDDQNSTHDEDPYNYRHHIHYYHHIYYQHDNDNNDLDKYDHHDGDHDHDHDYPHQDGHYLDHHYTKEPQ